tara:strand:- start:4495 stop:5163 length:669 start_codon:yes stop_codon:yes gene_type:complete
MNYSELTTNIQDIVENTFTADQLAMFTQQAEQKIFNTVQLAALRKNSTALLTTGDKYLAAPNDFLSAFSLAVVDDSGDFSYLLNKDVNFIREAYPSSGTQGIPKYYALFGPTTTNAVPPVVTNELSFILGPTPDTTYNVELHYFYYPESIVTAGTTWLGDNFDSALLNGALLEAIRFIKGDPEMISLYEKLYMQSIGLLKVLGDGKERQDSYRSGQFKLPVT